MTLSPETPDYVELFLSLADQADCLATTLRKAAANHDDPRLDILIERAHLNAAALAVYLGDVGRKL